MGRQDPFHQGRKEQVRAIPLHLRATCLFVCIYVCTMECAELPFVICGRYINRRNIPMCEAHFPNMRLETLDAGHWVQAERPNEFVEHVKAFLEG